MKRLTGRASAAVRRAVIPPSQPTERNIHFLYVEIVFASLLSAAASFNGTYVLRLGGSNALVGLLSSIPALLAVFTYLPSARFLERQTNQMPWVVRSLFLARLGYMFLPILPFFMGRYVAEATVAVLVSMQVPAVFFSTAWSPLLSDVVPPRQRGNVLAWRSILSSGAIAPLIFLAGRWLDAVTFPGNYQWLYVAGVLGGLASTYLVARIRPEAPAAPEGVAAEAAGVAAEAAGVAAEEAEPAPKPAPAARGSWWADLRGLLAEEPGFRRIVVNTLLFNLGAWMIGPLFIIFFVRELGASDGWVGTLGTLAHIGVILGYWLWRKVVRRLGDARALLLAALPVCAHPFLVALIPNLTVILILDLAVNAIAPGVNLSHGMIFLDLLPPGRKYSATAVYSMIMNAGAFVAPLIGVAIADRIGIANTLLLGGTLRALGALTFYLFPLKQPQPWPWRQGPAA
ncbi:MAG: MFS transporter [Chloroflexi bacterium]|nr:MFS transporter [Chloroflexota bacterium]